jgi:hypothetical protein
MHFTKKVIVNESHPYTKRWPELFRSFLSAYSMIITLSKKRFATEAHFFL